MAPANNNEFVKISYLDATINNYKDEFKEGLKLQLEALTKFIKDSLTHQNEKSIVLRFPSHHYEQEDCRIQSHTFQ
ncbi:hypothetical protein FRX31_029511 [Thalictrum thalictroides]|uniref:Uncharacterized protein n=1 Tax=Thalictrum thalictroides TaxID=46969 RepID=A0A7J6V9N9_THATH|nr:hypothetical protein FRX31_029511 [Thalictrum thalictroides]